MHWARFSERRRKEKMKDALVRKHLDPPKLRLVTESISPASPISSPVVREVQGPGRFQIRKVTKADLRKAAEALAQQETQDPFELYRKPAAASRPVPVDFEDLEPFEEPLYLEDAPSRKAPAGRIDKTLDAASSAARRTADGRAEAGSDQR
jgi:hypothetical protein